MAQRPDGLHVLLVEADERLRRAVELALALRGHTVTAYDNPIAALEAARQQRFPLIIIGQLAPDEPRDNDSRQLALCRAIRALPDGWLSTILVVVDGGRLEHVLAALDAGATSYLRLPFEVEPFRLRIEQAERLAQLPQEPLGAREGVQSTEERYRALVEYTLDLIAIVSVDGTIEYVSPSVSAILGYRPDELLGSNSFALYHPDDAGRMLGLVNDALNEPGMTAPIDIRMAHAANGWTHVEVRVINLQSIPSVGGLVIVARDITERKMFEEQLERRALYDAVTTLPNRTLFMDYLEHALARADRRLESVIVMFLDLDNFKMVNDSFGHAFGDVLLARVAERLRACLRSSDTAARFGGDEFTLLLEDIGTTKDAILVAERVIRELSSPYFIEGREVFTSVSIGIAFSAPGESRPGDLLRDADVALYRAKAEGKSRWEIFNPDIVGGRMPATHTPPRPPTAQREGPVAAPTGRPEPRAAADEEAPAVPSDEERLRELLARISYLEREAGRLEAEVMWERRRRGQ